MKIAALLHSEVAKKNKTIHFILKGMTGNDLYSFTVCGLTEITVWHNVQPPFIC